MVDGSGLGFAVRTISVAVVARHWDRDRRGESMDAAGQRCRLQPLVLLAEYPHVVAGANRDRFGRLGHMAGIGRRAFAYAPRQSEVVSFDVESGELRWRVAARVPSFEGPGAIGDRVFAGTADGLLRAMNAESGREEWSAELGAAVTTSVSAFEDSVYAGIADGTIVRVDPRNGAVLGSRKVDEKLRPRSVLVRASDTLLVLLTNKTADYLSLVSLDQNLEMIRWRQTATKDWSTSRVFVWKNTVILGTSSGDVTGYCVADGTKAWSHTVRGSVRSIGGSDDAFYVTTQGCSLYALRPTEACGAK